VKGARVGQSLLASNVGKEVVEEVRAAAADGDAQSSDDLESVSGSEIQLLGDDKCIADYGEAADAGDWFSDGEEQGGSEAETESRPSTGKLWTNDLFPAGVRNPFNWETANIQAMLDEWRCPCPDRNCLSRERLGTEAVVLLYEHRKHFRNVEAKKHKGGMRDALRAELEDHFDEACNDFTRSFRVAHLGDNCLASASLAKGLCFDTFSKARADVRLKRCWHAGRAETKSKQDSLERGHLMAYIRAQKKQMEGTKGGVAGADKVHTSYMPMGKRWDAYKKSRTDKGLPIIGSETLFRELWKSSNIEEDKAIGHPNCDLCGELDAMRERFKGNPEKLKEIEDRQVSSPPLCAP